MANVEGTPTSQGEETLKYWVNGEEEVQTYEKGPDRKRFTLSVREILESAGFTPAEDYQLSRNSDNRTFGSLDEEVPIEFGEHFTATHKADTPVS